MTHEQLPEKSETTSLEDQYYEAISKAREVVPMLIIKRMSSTISDEDRQLLLNPGEPEFNPAFEYPNLFDLDEVAFASKTQEIEEGLTKARSIESQGYHLSFDNIFDRQKVLDGLDNLNFLKLAQQIQTETDNEKRAEAINEFMILNEKMTGAVNPEIYQGVINSLHQIIERVDYSQPGAYKIAQELSKKLPEKLGDEQIIALPDDVFIQYRNAYKVIFGPWLAKIIPKKEGLYDASDLAKIFTNAIKDMKLDKLGWSVELSESAPSLKIDMEDKTITIPLKRKQMSYEELVPKVLHEINHIVRGINGSYISRSAEHGLPDYLDAEEGLMSYGESFITGKQKVDTTYVERYLGVGTMLGVLGRNKKDFGETFATMWRARVLLDNIDKLDAGDDLTQEDIQGARERSLMNSQRLFRGGDGTTPGLGWTKDKAYYEGVVKLTAFMTDFARRMGIENITWLFAAKFDPTNKLHNQYMNMPFKGL